MPGARPKGRLPKRPQVRLAVPEATAVATTTSDAGRPICQPSGNSHPDGEGLEWADRLNDAEVVTYSAPVSSTR